jgi:hypothetical protein
MKLRRPCKKSGLNQSYDIPIVYQISSMLLTAGLHCTQLYAIQVAPWLRELVVGLSLWETRFNRRYVQVALMVDKVALDRFLSKYFSFPISINPPATDSIVK